MPPLSAIAMSNLATKARKDGIEAAVRSMPRTPDALDQAARVAGLITMFIGLDMSNQVKGLRFMHKNFEDVFPILKAMFETKVEHLQFGLCYLLEDLSRDRVIRDKLVGGGTVPFLISLLPRPKACIFALRTLQVLSSHAGPQEQETIAKLTAAPLVNLALEMDHADERYPILLATIAHGAYVNNDKTGVPSKTMINLLVDACSHPDKHTHSHAVDGLFNPCSRYPKYFRPSYAPAAPPAHRCIDGDSTPVVAILQNLSPQIWIRTREGTFKIDGVHPLTGNPTLENMPPRLQGDFVSFSDALPLGVKALRELDPDSIDATCIELKYLMIRKRHTEGHLIAKKVSNTSNYCQYRTSRALTFIQLYQALKLHPQEPYLYYALTIGNPNKIEGIRWAKRGLRTKASGYIQRGLLMLSFEHSFAVAEDCLDEVKYRPYSSMELRFETGLAHIVSAFEDATTFIDIAPPDARHLRMMILRYLNLVPIIRGNTLSPDLRELRPYVAKLAIADPICAMLYDQMRNTQQRLVWNFIAKGYEEASKVWDPPFSKFPEAAETLTIPKPTADKGLAKLMASMSCSGGESGPAGCYRIDDITKLLRCSSCASPSAKLLKCSLCSKAKCKDACPFLELVGSLTFALQIATHGANAPTGKTTEIIARKRME
ncbi:hypothetical protein P7C70_g3262, partial [Phenoliferia sp. Uapishka_3]